MDYIYKQFTIKMAIQYYYKQKPSLEHFKNSYLNVDVIIYRTKTEKQCCSARQKITQKKIEQTDRTQIIISIDHKHQLLS